MTSTDDKDGTADASAVENLTGAFALDAVTAEERAAVERALDGSESLRAEAGELADTAAALADAVEPVVPSAGLKDSIFAMLDATPQLPRADADSAAPDVAPAPETAPEPVPTLTTAAEHRAQARWFQRPLVLAAGAAAAAALVIGAAVLPAILQAPQDPFQVVAAAPDAEKVVSTMDDGAQVTLVWSGELALAAVEVDGMPVLPESNDYELWFIGEEGARSAGVITIDAAGDARQQLVGEMAAGESIGITIEPAGGSPQPTTDPILVVATA